MTRYSRKAATVDVLIVGAGPVGLFASFQCGMLGLSCAVVDSLDQPGGQCAALYPEKPIYDIPGFAAITGSELSLRLLDQARQFDPQLHLRSVVESVIALENGRFEIGVSYGRIFDAGAIIIAAGAGSFVPNRPDLAGIEAFEGRSVFYSVAAPKAFAGKRIVIAGGGDSAVDWAITLSEFASVTLVHRRGKFIAHPDSVRKLNLAVEAGRIDLAVPYQLEAVGGNASGGTLRFVDIVSLEGERRTIAADVLLPFFGLSTQLGPIATWGLALSNGHIEVEPTSCATNIDGIYAIGDVARYPRKLKLILSGFAEAAQASYAARARLFPEAAHLFEHSTSKGVARWSSLGERPQAREAQS